MLGELDPGNNAVVDFIQAVGEPQDADPRPACRRDDPKSGRDFLE
jgi:hypothetical protein